MTPSAAGAALPRRVFVLGLDGVPHSFLQRHLGDGTLPSLSRIFSGGDLRRMTSVHPTVSSVAWSTYMTGKNPGEHGIYGFIDRQPGSYDLFVPTSRNMTAETLWEAVGRAGGRVVVMNVPVTYPPRAVSGVLVSCFLCTSIDKVAYPAGISEELKQVGYRIDADPRLARSDRRAFFADVELTLEKRFETARLLLGREPWDFAQLHVMETDRVNHFFWEDYESGREPFGPRFLAFYRRLDRLVGELVDGLPAGCELVILSDHGFCGLKQEVYLNRYLEERGWLTFAASPHPKLADIGGEARAYSLIPGRVFLHLRGREPRGCVPPGEYAATREAVAADLLALRDPQTGEPVVAEVLRGEAVYSHPAWRGFPVLPEGRTPAPADLIVVPRDGYDLKGNFDKTAAFARTELNGMHTYGDAFLFVRGRPIGLESPNIREVFGLVAGLLGIAPAPRA